jgi:hypothetical protein
MACIEARGPLKTFGTTVALAGIDLHVEERRIPRPGGELGLCPTPLVFGVESTTRTAEPA